MGAAAEAADTTTEQEQSGPAHAIDVCAGLLIFCRREQDLFGGEGGRPALTAGERCAIIGARKRRLRPEPGRRETGENHEKEAATCTTN